MRILFFGPLADIAGRSRKIDISGYSTVGGITDELCKDPLLAEDLRLPSISTVLDNIVVKEDAMVRNASELAYLPPVSGG